MHLRPYCIQPVTLNLNFDILKTWSCFNSSKRIIWVYSFAKKRRLVLALLKAILYKSLSRWFYDRNAKIVKETLWRSFIGKRWSKSDMWRAADHHNNTCYIAFAKGVLDSNLKLLTKCQFLTKLPQVLLTKIVIFKVKLKFSDQLLLFRNFMAVTCFEYIYFSFASCEPLRHELEKKRVPC